MLQLRRRSNLFISVGDGDGRTSQPVSDPPWLTSKTATAPKAEREWHVTFLSHCDRRQPLDCQMRIVIDTRACTRVRTLVHSHEWVCWCAVHIAPTHVKLLPKLYIGMVLPWGHHVVRALIYACMHFIHAFFNNVQALLKQISEFFIACPPGCSFSSQ